MGISPNEEKQDRNIQSSISMNHSNQFRNNESMILPAKIPV